MVVKRTKQKIAELHDQPEEHRITYMNRAIVVIGIILLALWLLVLLPLQLYFKRPAPDLPTGQPAPENQPIQQPVTEELVVPEANAPAQESGTATTTTN